MTTIARPFACVTDVGRQRQGNEDSHGEFELPDGGLLLAVCDGVGGHEAGEVASAVAVETIGRAFAAQPDGDVRERLYQAVIAANEAIIEEGARIGKRDMGTTAVVAYVRGHEVYVAHVGDSRCYQFRGGEPLFRTRDHTRVQKMVELGILTPQQAKEHPDANVIIRALGRRVTPEGVPLEPDVRANPLLLEPGDSLLLCSDGLYDMLSDEDLWNAISGRTPQEASQALVDLANERGGPDNITATVLFYGHERAPAIAAVPQEAPPIDPPAKPGAATVGAPPKAEATPPGATGPTPPPGGFKPVYLVIAGIALLVPVAFFIGRKNPPPAQPPPVVAAVVDAGIQPSEAEIAAALAAMNGAPTASDAGTDPDAGTSEVVEALRPDAGPPAAAVEKPEEKKPEPKKPEPKKVEPAKAEPKKDEKKVEPAKAEPKKDEPKVEPAKAEPPKPAEAPKADEKKPEPPKPGGG